MIIEDKLIEEDIMEINKHTLKEIRTQLDNVLKNHNIERVKHRTRKLFF